MRRRLLALVPIVVPFLPAGVSAQQQTLAGSWSASPMSESVTVGSWVDECGPKPKSSSSPGGGYKITVSGDELIFSGGKSFRTDQCWDMGLAKRVSHSATPSIRWWKTRCESPAGDPRKATITTVVRAVDDDTIVLSETAHYSSTMASGSCSASVERSRTFKIVARDGAAPAASSPSAAPSPSPSPSAAPSPTTTTPPPATCATIGEPATLEVKPRRKVVRPGEQFEFHARILDANGCELSGKPTFRLAPESSAIATVVVESNGKVKVRADADPVVATLLVEGAQKSARVELEVVSDQRYAELLAAGAGDAAADDQAVAIVLTSGGGGAATTVVDPGKQEDKRFRFGWLAIAFGIASLLGLGAVVLWRRGTARAAGAAGDRARSEPEEPARRVASPAATAAPMPKRRICPVCGTRYEGEAAFCSKDGVELVPLN